MSDANKIPEALRRARRDGGTVDPDPLPPPGTRAKRIADGEPMPPEAGLISDEGVTAEDRSLAPDSSADRHNWLDRNLLNVVTLVAALAAGVAAFMSEEAFARLSGPAAMLVGHKIRGWRS